MAQLCFPCCSIGIMTLSGAFLKLGPVICLFDTGARSKPRGDQAWGELADDGQSTPVLATSMGLIPSYNTKKAQRAQELISWNIKPHHFGRFNTSLLRKSRKSPRKAASLRGAIEKSPSPVGKRLKAVLKGLKSERSQKSKLAKKVFGDLLGMPMMQKKSSWNKGASCGNKESCCCFSGWGGCQPSRKENSLKKQKQKPSESSAKTYKKIVQRLQEVWSWRQCVTRHILQMYSISHIHSQKTNLQTVFVWGVWKCWFSFACLEQTFNWNHWWEGWNGGTHSLQRLPLSGPEQEVPILWHTSVAAKSPWNSEKWHDIQCSGMYGNTHAQGRGKGGKGGPIRGLLMAWLATL